MNVRSRSPVSYSRRQPLDRALGGERLELRHRVRRDRARRGRRRRAGPRPSRARSPRRRPRRSGGRSAAGTRCRTASRASPARRSGRRSRAGTDRRIPSLHRLEPASRLHRTTGERAFRRLLHRRLDGPPGPPRVRGRPRRPARAAAAGHPPGRLRRASSRTPARSTSPTSACARTAQVMDAIAFGPRAEADRADPARARHAPPRPRRARRAGGPLPGRHALRGRRPGAAAVDPRHDRRLRAARLRQVRAAR